MTWPSEVCVERFRMFEIESATHGGPASTETSRLQPLRPGAWIPYVSLGDRPIRVEAPNAPTV